MQRTASRIAVPLLAAMVLAMGSGSAQAGTLVWSSDVYFPGQTRASSSWWDFIASSVRVPSNRVAYAGAHLPGSWTMYGNYATAYEYVCHPYAAGKELGALAHNPHSVSVPVTAGLGTWPNGC